MVVIFTFFYTSVLFDQQNYGENLKKVGATVPGVHTGAPTQKYLSTVQRRITLVGARFPWHRRDHAISAWFIIECI